MRTRTILAAARSMKEQGQDSGDYAATFKSKIDVLKSARVCGRADVALLTHLWSRAR
jgi:hypothetical protein